MILRWEQGRSTVDDLLARGQVTQVTANRDLAGVLLGRPLRNHTEYPSPEHSTATAEDVREALPAATTMIDTASKVVDQMPAY